MVAALLCCFLALVAASVGQDSSPCPGGFTQFGESCYAFMQGKHSWAESEQICAAIQAHLVEIYTEDELHFVQNLSLTHEVWLGGHDMVQEGLWTWAWSGSPLELKAWRPGQPNNAGGENCMELDDDSQLWNDEECSHDKHFICQMSALSEGAIG